MNKDKKLKIIVGVLFIFIIILVALLIYAATVYNKNGNTAVDTSISASSNVNQTADSTVGDSQQETSKPSEVQETIDLKLYNYDADDYENPKEVSTVAIDKKLYSEDITSAINKLLASTPLKLNKAVVNGKLITVDLPKDVALKFNSGSAGGITNTNILAMTILNLPDIEEMEVIVDGITGIEADHFSFNGKFIKDEGGKKYKFLESDKPSNDLDFSRNLH
jgi:hypothetical protein